MQETETDTDDDASVWDGKITKQRLAVMSVGYGAAALVFSQNVVTALLIAVGIQGMGTAAAFFTPIRETAVGRLLDAGGG